VHFLALKFHTNRQTQLCTSNILVLYSALRHVSTVYSSHHQIGIGTHIEWKTGEACRNSYVILLILFLFPFRNNSCHYKEGVVTSNTTDLCILFIMLTTTCFGRCGPSSGHRIVSRGKLYRIQVFICIINRIHKSVPPKVSLL
jgi:hypothetical protein